MHFMLYSLFAHRLGVECMEGITPDVHVSEEARQASELYAGSLSIDSVPTEKFRQLLDDLGIQVFIYLDNFILRCILFFNNLYLFHLYKVWCVCVIKSSHI